MLTINGVPVKSTGSLIEKVYIHKWLWSYGAIVFLVLIALAFTAGMRGFFSYWVFSPNLWAPYIAAKPDIIESGSPISFTFSLFSHFAPWQIDPWLFTVSIIYWAAISFVVVTLVAALFKSLNLRRKSLVLWLDIIIVLLFIAYLGYADIHTTTIPVTWRFDLLAIILSTLTLWALCIALGHQIKLPDASKGKRYVKVLAIVAVACLAIICWYDSNLVALTARNVKPLTWTFIAAIWLLVSIWFLFELKHVKSIKPQKLMFHLCAFGAVVACALTIGIQTITAFDNTKSIIVRVFWLPHFNIADLISKSSVQLDNLYSYWRLDAYSSAYMAKLPYSLFTGWNVLSLIFTIIWWIILARIIAILLGKIRLA